MGSHTSPIQRKYGILLGVKKSTIPFTREEIMTSSEIKSNQQNQTAEILNLFEKQPKTDIVIFSLKILEYIALGAAIGLIVTSLIFPGNFKLMVAGAISVGLLIFTIKVNEQVKKNIAQEAKERQLTKKAIISNLGVSENQELSENNQIIPLVKKALGYCQDLIDDYKRTREVSRNLYYVLQLGAIILSAATPILVLVEKGGTGNSPWLKWLPVILPAIASIVSSIVTSFPFQDKWISANRAAELLEAEQEKFLLGTTPDYQYYDIDEPAARRKKARKAIASFIAKVNSIHLKQLEGDEEESKEELSNSGDRKAPEN